MPGAQELLIILAVAVIVFGPDRLPELARNLAKVLARLRTLTSDSVTELKRAAQAEGLDQEWREISQELRTTRDAVTRPLRDAANELTGGVVTPGARMPLRADDDPPPVDLEAT
jgi:sec-independent protein translocase protein TatB